MKKIFFALGLMAAAFTLTNCAKQETAIKDAQPAKAGVPFSFNVGIDTKTTTTDGATISWAEEDALNVFHAEAGSTTYGSNDEFTLTSGTTFNGELQDGALTADAYDWYVLYPYASQIETPANASKGYVTVGSKSNESQTQVGVNSKAHLAGSNIPLYGVAKGVKKGDALSMTLQQIVSVVKVSVKNSTAATIPVSKVSFTAPEGVDVVGTYYLNITGAEVVFTPSGAQFVSNKANLNVSEATIAAGATKDFFLAIKPFSASSGDIKVTVNTYEKSFTLTSEVVFAPGKIKTIDFDYDYVEPVASLPFFIDGTGGSAAYSSTDGLFASGLGPDYSETHSPYLTKFDSTDDFIQIHFGESAGKIRFGVKMIGGADDSSMTLSGSADGASFTDIETFEISGAQYEILVFTSSAPINASYRYLRLTFTKGANVGFGAFRVTSKTSPDIPEDPVITVTSDNPMNVANTASSQTISYTVEHPVAGKSLKAETNVDWITNISTSTAGKVTFNVAAQTDGNPDRSGNITLSYSGAENVVVVVKQAKGNSTGGSQTSTLTFTAKCDGSGTADDDVSWTVTSDGTESNFDSTKGIHYGTNSAKVGYIQLSTSGISGTITKVVVNASTANGVTAGVSVTVGGADFGGDPQSLTSSAANYVFNGSASGEIVVTVAKPDSAVKALYVKSIVVTYTP